MKKIIAILLSLTMLYPTQIYANSTNNPISIIYNILSGAKKEKNNSLMSILNKKDKVNIKIINEIEVKDLKSKKRSNNKDNYILGLDISKHNGELDWKAIKKAGIKFVIIRAGYGTSPNSDSRFHKNIQGAIDNNITILGIYWFSYAYTDNMAKAEARACIKTIGRYKKYINLPIFYDFEYDSIRYANNNGVHITKRKLSNFAKIFCNEIKKEGYKAGIYTNLDYANRYFDKNVLKDYHTWIAQWSDSCTYKNKYIIWQRSDKFYIDNNRFDLNYFYYDRFLN